MRKNSRRGQETAPAYLVDVRCAQRARPGRSGFARFTNARFSMRKEDIGNTFVHLTNVAIQKHAPGFDRSKGPKKWPIRSLRLFMATRHGGAESAGFATLLGAPALAALAPRSLAPQAALPWAASCAAPAPAPKGKPCPWRLLTLPAPPGQSATNEVFAAMEGLIVRTLLAVQPSMIQDKHCFEARPLISIAPRGARARDAAEPSNGIPGPVRFHPTAP